MLKPTKVLAITTCSLAAIIALQSAPALAQEQAQAEEAEASAPGEIIVTATKRDQRLQDVGSTVTALGGEALAERRIANVEDLARAVPGLAFAPSPNATPVYTLRGVGFYESSLAAYPDVATYIDQAPLALPALTALTAFDLERVEVLKGPQGTLFGNNATGGAINFVAAKPTDSFHAGIELGYGRFNTVDVSGFVSGALSDTLRGRIAVKATHGDDWQYNYVRNDSLGKVNKIAGRVLLDWEPSDRLKFSLNLNGWRDKSDPQAPQAYWVDPANNYAYSPVLSALAVQNPNFDVVKSALAGDNLTRSPFVGYPAAPLNTRAADWSPEFRPFADNRFLQGTLRADFEVTDDISVTSITGYVDYKHHNGTEGDGTTLVGLDIYNDQGVIKSFSQELRIANTNPSARLKWVLGANYEKTQADEVIDLAYYFASSAHGGGFQGFTRNRYDAFQDMTNKAVFGNLEFEVVDSLTLKGGIRYTDALRTSANANRGVPGFVEPTPAVDSNIYDFFNATWPFLNQFRSTCSNGPGNAFRPIAVGASFTLDPATCQAGTFQGRLKENNTSWSVGIDFKATDNLLLYANVSKGFKAGSYPMVSAATWNQFVPVTQESLTDYEAGFKASIPSLRMTFNGAAFYYDYQNKQLRAKIVDPIFGFLDALVNVPKSKIYGAEFEINAQPVPALNISLAATYLQTEVKSYVGTNPNALAGSFGSYTALPQNFAGAELPFSPKFQFAANIDYTVPVSDNWKATFGVGVNGQSHSISGLYAATDLVAQKRYELPSRVLVDLSLAFKSENGWKVAVWGKNVTNKLYWTNATFVYDNSVRYSGRPAEYGVTVGYKF